MKNKITIGLVIVAAVVAGALGAWFFMPSASGIAGERVEKEQKMSKTVRSGSVKKITEISVDRKGGKKSVRIVESEATRPDVIKDADIDDEEQLSGDGDDRARLAADRLDLGQRNHGGAIRTGGGIIRCVRVRFREEGIEMPGGDVGIIHVDLRGLGGLGIHDGHDLGYPGRPNRSGWFLDIDRRLDVGGCLGVDIRALPHDLAGALRLGGTDARDDLAWAEHLGLIS